MFLAGRKLACRNLFTIEKGDNHQSPQCLFSIFSFLSHLKCSLDTYVTYHLGSKVTSCGNATIDQTKFCLYLHIFVYIYNIYTSFDFGTICLILPLSSSYNSTQNLPLCIPLSLTLVSTLLWNPMDSIPSNLLIQEWAIRWYPEPLSLRQLPTSFFFSFLVFIQGLSAEHAKLHNLGVWLPTFSDHPLFSSNWSPRRFRRWGYWRCTRINKRLIIY